MQYAILSEVPEYQRKSHSFLQLHSHDYLQSYFKIEHSCLLQLFTFLIATICMKNQINFLYLIWIIHHCLGTVFELPSHGTQSHFQFLFKIEPLQGFHLSRGSSNMNIIKIGDIKIFAGTPGPASTHIGYIFAFNEPKWGQGTLGKQRSTLIGSRTCLGLSRDPVLTLQYT